MDTSPGESAVHIGALAPLTRPGWVEAGRHLLAGRPLDPLVRDTAADPRKAAATVDELAGERGDLAYGRGDGRGVLLQDGAVVAGDLRAEPKIRVALEDLVEARADPFLLVPAAAEGRPRTEYVPGGDGDVVQHGTELTLAGDLAELDVALGLLPGTGTMPVHFALVEVAPLFVMPPPSAYGGTPR